METLLNFKILTLSVYRLKNTKTYSLFFYNFVSLAYSSNTESALEILQI